MNEDVRVRFAPSPTGYLHIGGARTALFNWLFARQKKGTFILRIEDTDVARSSTEMVEGILEGLRWLGLGWDEGPYCQSQRLDFYRNACRRLLEEGKAYRCFCPPELLERKKQEAQKAGRAWQYDGTCRKLPADELETRLREGLSFALRFKVPEGEPVSFDDRVYGRVEVNSENIEDFVILRSDGMPTYHLCVVTDDCDMKISDVVRGADHLSNTPKHVLLYHALRKPVPRYAHLPLILGPDKKRLSKRHDATSVTEYKRMGFVPAATRNYLALLGWSAGRDQEIFSSEELIEFFDLDRIHKSNAVFDLQKLEWMNGQYISRLRAEELESEVRPLLQQEGLWDPAWENVKRSGFLHTLDLLKSRARRLTDFAHLGRAFFSDDFSYEPEAVHKYLSPTGDALTQALAALREAYANLTPFSLETTETTLREICRRYGLKSGDFIGAVRVALTGKAVAPRLFEVILTLGKEKTLRRLERALAFLP